MRTVLKLGGSVITEKDRPETLDGEALDRAADAIAAVDHELVLVHGGGSFGHHHADRVGVDTTTGSTDAGDALAVHGAMTTLNRFVLDRLHDRGVNAVPVHPLSMASRTREGELHLPTRGIATLLAEGFVPVLHGDVVPQAGEGVTVLSGDELVSELGTALGADRVGLCSTVPGVLADGEVIERVDSYESVAPALGSSDATDVTGGMATKVSTLLDLEGTAFIFDLDGLPSFLSGGSPGTRIE